MSQIKLRVLKRIIETPRAVSFVLEPLGGSLEYQAGQFITLIFNDLATTEIRRSYSLSSAPGIDKFPAITVQRVTNGLVSRHLLDKVDEGDVLAALPAAGKFVWKKNSGEAAADLYLIGGGSGITPLISILKSVIQTDPSLHIKLFLSNRDDSQIIFNSTLAAIAIENPDVFHLRHILAHWMDDDSPLHDNIDFIHGRVSNYLYENWVSRSMHFDKKKAQFYICGPKGLMLKAESTLRYMGFRDDQIKKEVFDVIAPFRPAAEDLQDAEIKLLRGADEFVFPLKAGQSILEAALQHEIELPYSCRSGICTTCGARCLSGKVVMYGQDGVMTTDDSKGEVLTCVGYPSTGEITIAMD